MRPVELTIDGFRSYAKPTTFSWNDRGLVGVVGPIGSGKSSILDAVAFALYARVPAFERDVKRLINQRREECHVGLTFDVDGRRFTVERAMRRKGAAGHVLREIVDGGPILVSDRATDIGSEIEKLLGLDFDAFRRSVLLAQNRFAEFLQATPSQRDAVLEGVFPRFGHIAPMRERGKEVVGLLGARLATTTLLRNALAADQVALDAAAKQRVDEQRRLDGLEELGETVRALDDRIAAASAKARSANELLERLTSLAKDVPGRERSEPTLVAAEEGSAAIDVAEGEHRAALGAAAAASSELVSLLESVGGREELTRVATLVERLAAVRSHSEREAVRLVAAGDTAESRSAAFAEATTRHAEAEASAAAAAATRAAAGVVADDAETALHEARHAVMALTLRADLVQGEACPVCEQAVVALPDLTTEPAVEQAEGSLAQARASLTAARTAAEAASSQQAASAEAAAAAEHALSAAHEALAAAQVSADEASAAVDAVADEVAAILGPGDPAALLAERAAAVARADKAKESATEVARVAAAATDAARERAAAARTDLARMVTSLAALAGKLGLEIDITDDPEVVRTALAKIRDAWVAAKSDTDAAASAAVAEESTARAERSEALASVGLDADADWGQALGEARATLAGTDRQIATLEGRLAGLRELEVRETDALGASDRLDRIVGDLTPSKFLRFVLDEKRRVLAALGSERLEELSGGRYRFTDDGAFEIVDLMAAERPRSAVSLSGGETFLASLALALALAEMVGQEGGRLDAFFLDEGFGSLDPEHIDLAMDGVERLVAGAGNRLVVVVSHVPALRERIEDLIVLDKDPLTGDTVVRRGTKPGE